MEKAFLYQEILVEKAAVCSAKFETSVFDTLYSFRMRSSSISRVLVPNTIDLETVE